MGGENPGVPHGDLLVEFGEAVLGADDGRLATARTALAREVGEAGLVDAAAVAGLFNAIDRVADATGAPLEEWRLAQSEDFREQVRINAFSEQKATLDGGATDPPERPSD